MNTRAIVTYQQEQKEQLLRSCLCLPSSLSAVPTTATPRTPETADEDNFVCVLFQKQVSLSIGINQDGALQNLFPGTSAF